jgi:hypothetical protein
MKGIHDYDQMQHDLTVWNNRLTINGFSLHGGEPTMHPNIVELVRFVRQLNPDAFIQIITNGTYLIDKPEIIDVLAEVGHSLLSITQHEPKKQYAVEVKNFVLNRYKWKASNVKEWVETDNRFYFDFVTPPHFLKILKGDYGTTKPYNNNPKDAFKNCCFNTGDNAQLHDGKLYRCHPIALIPRVLKDWGQFDDPDWQKYISYKGLEQSASDEELFNFLAVLKQSEDVCGMCPSAQDPKFVGPGNPQWEIRPIAPYV